MALNPIVVIGAGAAGILATLSAARTGRQVVLLERTRDGGRKILISGGGRCNILPSVVEPERFVTASSPNSLRNILRSWPLDEQRAFFDAVPAVEDRADRGLHVLQRDVGHEADAARFLGAAGRIYLAGTESEIQAASKKVVETLGNIKGRKH